MYLNSARWGTHEIIGQNLTLTRVVFEYKRHKLKLLTLAYLTLTRVVFESVSNGEYIMNANDLTLTRVVFESS